MDRPYMQKSSDEIRDLIERYWDDFWHLGLLAYEVQFRRYIREKQRAAVIERLVELGAEGGRQITPHPGFDFPSTDVHETRKLKIAALGEVDWREKGLLSLSGYQVGKTNGKPREERKRILNYIFLKDDLQDVTDPDYRAEWGAPKSADRLRKLAHTIAAFARNAKRHPADMDQAISDWEEDLEHLKNKFYDNWGDFPWPDVAL